MQPQLPNQDNHKLFQQVLRGKFNSEFPSFQSSALHGLTTNYFSPLPTPEAPADSSHSRAMYFITTVHFLYQPLRFPDFSFAVWSIYLNPSGIFSSFSKEIYLKAWTENDEASYPALPVSICCSADVSALKAWTGSAFQGLLCTRVSALEETHSLS